MARYGMVIDLRVCAQCRGCTVACQAVNQLPPDERWVELRSTSVGSFPSVRRITAPVQCMQCGNPPCAAVCPTGATHKDSKTGVVLVDAGRCVGCRYCQVACPYQARVFEEKTGVVAKCIFCLPLVKQGQQPACVSQCIGHARTFGDLDDPNSEVNRARRDLKAMAVRADLGTDPSIFYAS